MSRPAHLRRLLVVDDEATAREGIREFLEDEGFEVLVAADGLEAVELFDARPVRLVITDLEMPRLDGQGLIARLRALDATVRILVVTARPAPDPAHAATLLGADGYVTKPVDLDDLLRWIHDLL